MKKCPLFSARKERNVDCLGKTCALWDYKEELCSLKNYAIQLRKINSHMEILVRQRKPFIGSMGKT